MISERIIVIAYLYKIQSVTDTFKWPTMQTRPWNQGCGVDKFQATLTPARKYRLRFQLRLHFEFGITKVISSKKEQYGQAIFLILILISTNGYYGNTAHVYANCGRSQPWLSLVPMNVIGMTVFELVTQWHNDRDSTLCTLSDWILSLNEASTLSAHGHSPSRFFQCFRGKHNRSAKIIVRWRVGACDSGEESE